MFEAAAAWQEVHVVPLHVFFGIWEHFCISKHTKKAIA
jgi:hypothetical protein